jgi:hypothetical protein
MIDEFGARYTRVILRRSELRVVLVHLPTTDGRKLVLIRWLMRQSRMRQAELGTRYLKMIVYRGVLMIARIRPKRSKICLSPPSNRDF